MASVSPHKGCPPNKMEKLVCKQVWKADDSVIALTWRQTALPPRRSCPFGLRKQADLRRWCLRQWQFFFDSSWQPDSAIRITDAGQVLRSAVAGDLLYTMSCQSNGSPFYAVSTALRTSRLRRKSTGCVLLKLSDGRRHVQAKFSSPGLGDLQLGSFCVANRGSLFHYHSHPFFQRAR